MAALKPRFEAVTGKKLDQRKFGFDNLKDLVLHFSRSLLVVDSRAAGLGKEYIQRAQHDARANHTPRASERMRVRGAQRVAQHVAAHAAPSRALPFGWEAIVDESTGTVYYHNRALGATQWDRPS